MICCSNIINILQNRKNSGIIDIFGITRVECEVIYDKFEVSILTQYLVESQRPWIRYDIIY